MDVRKFSFSQMIINVWNKLSAECIHASSVKDDKTEENTFEILQHSDININNS